MILAKQVSVAFVCSFLDAVRFRRVRGKADDGANPGRIQDIPEHLRATVRRYVLEHVHRNDDVVPSARDRLLSHVSNDVTAFGLETPVRFGLRRPCVHYRYGSRAEERGERTAPPAHVEDTWPDEVLRE